MSNGIHYERRGAGEPLLLIHGIGGELVVWQPVLDPLAAQRDVIALDLPGFGASPCLAHKAVPVPARLAAAVAELLDGLGIELAHVAGNSLGGWVGLELAKLGRAASVTALSPAGLWRAPLLGPDERARNVRRRVARRLLALAPALAASGRGRGLLLGQFVARPDLVPPEAALRMTVAYATAPGYDATNAAMRRSHLVGAERIRVPITLAWGELDRLVRRAELHAPRVRTLVMPGCGHVPMWDDPELIARLVLSTSDPG